jgi:hypothetical protein
MGDKVETGSVVVFVDSERKEYEALVTAVWDCGLPEGQMPSINLLYVSDDESREDEWGRQIIRESSVVHTSNNSAPGNYWRLVDEKRAA